MTDNIFNSLNKVQRALAEKGIGKDQKTNFGERFEYRGIDDVYNVIGPLLADAGILVNPTVFKDKTEPRTTSKGKPTLHTKVWVNYTFYALDGTSVIATGIGESMDSGDKGINKAMSAAYKNVM